MNLFTSHINFEHILNLLSKYIDNHLEKEKLAFLDLGLFLDRRAFGPWSRP